MKSSLGRLQLFWKRSVSNKLVLSSDGAAVIYYDKMTS